MTNSLTPTDPSMYQFPASNRPQAETFGQTPESFQPAHEQVAPSTLESPDFLAETPPLEAEFAQAQYAQRLMESTPEVEAAREDVSRYVTAEQEAPQAQQSAERVAYIDPVETSAIALQLGEVLGQYRASVLGSTKADFDLAA